jgi:hypothetical protein
VLRIVILLEVVLLILPTRRLCHQTTWRHIPRSTGQWIVEDGIPVVQGNRDILEPRQRRRRCPLYHSKNPLHSILPHLPQQHYSHPLQIHSFHHVLHINFRKIRIYTSNSIGKSSEERQHCFQKVLQSALILKYNRKMFRRKLYNFHQSKNTQSFIMNS